MEKVAKFQLTWFSMCNTCEIFKNLLQDHTWSGTLRSTSPVLLTIPTCPLSTLADQAFSCSAPRLWNSLKTDRLYTTFESHLFTLAYSLSPDTTHPTARFAVHPVFLFAFNAKFKTSDVFDQFICKIPINKIKVII